MSLRLARRDCDQRGQAHQHEHGAAGSKAVTSAARCADDGQADVGGSGADMEFPAEVPSDTEVSAGRCLERLASSEKSPLISSQLDGNASWMLRATLGGTRRFDRAKQELYLFGFVGKELNPRCPTRRLPHCFTGSSSLSGPSWPILLRALSPRLGVFCLPLLAWLTGRLGLSDLLAERRPSPPLAS